MALTFFQPKETSGNGDTPFLNEWLESNPKNKETVFLVTEIKTVRSGKGYLVITNLFSCFIWKNQSVTKLLIEALEHWVENPNTGYALFVVLNSAKSKDFRLASDKEVPVTWFTSKNGFTTTEQDAVSQDGNTVVGNPFM